MNLISSLTNPLQHCEDIVWNICKILNVKVTKSSVQKDLTEHPNYPSLLSISDVIKNYGIDNIALRMKRENMHQLNTPFIVHVGSKNSLQDLFAIVLKFNNDGIEFYNSAKKKNESLGLEEFDAIYKGSVLAVETGEHAGEKDFEKKRQAEKQYNIRNAFLSLSLPTLVILASTLVFFFSTNYNALLPIFFTLVTLCGAIISVLLLWHEVDAYNPTIKNICQGGRKINCSSILNSTASKIFGISWSIWGSTYFIGMLLSLLIGGITNTFNLFLISWINIFALPYIIYSIAYQYFIAKQWCILCLSVQGILFLQFIIAFLGEFHKLHPISIVPVQSYITIFSSLLIVFVMLSLLMPALERAKSNRNKTIVLQRLKYNPQIFEALLSKQRSINSIPTKGLGVLIGNANAKYKLIKVCNPYCPPCARAHPKIKDLIKKNGDISLQIIYTATNDEHSKSANPVKHILSLNDLGNSTLLESALDDWYLSNKDYGEFALKYPLSKPLNLQNKKLDKMSEWCNIANINYTPTYFINGNELPEIYDIEDLNYFLA